MTLLHRPWQHFVAVTVSQYILCVLCADVHAIDEVDFATLQTSNSSNAETLRLQLPVLRSFVVSLPRGSFVLAPGSFPLSSQTLAVWEGTGGLTQVGGDGSINGSTWIVGSSPRQQVAPGSSNMTGPSNAIITISPGVWPPSLLFCCCHA